MSEVRRPRWHDVLLALAIAAIAAGGVWAFWGKDVQRALGVAPEPAVKAPTAGAN